MFTVFIKFPNNTHHTKQESSYKYRVKKIIQKAEKLKPDFPQPHLSSYYYSS